LKKIKHHTEETPLYGTKLRPRGRAARHAAQGEEDGQDIRDFLLGHGGRDGHRGGSVFVGQLAGLAPDGPMDHCPRGVDRERT